MHQKHWCLPPRWYPQPISSAERQIGEGSEWECPRCGIVWTSFGIWLDNDPDNWPRGDLDIKPLYAVGRWRVVKDRDLAIAMVGKDNLENQEDSYDWRGIELLTNKFLRRVIELQGGSWRDILD